MGDVAVLRSTPALDALVELPAGRYTLGEPGEEREVELARVLIGRYPVCNAHLGRHVDEQLADHPATGRHARRGGGVRARGTARGSHRRRVGGARPRRRRPRRIRGARRSTRPAATAPRRSWAGPCRSPRTPRGASAARRRAARRQRLGVGQRPHARRLGRRKGGSYLDTGWGLRAARSQAADPQRATHTTGFRIAVDPGRSA